MDGLADTVQNLNLTSVFYPQTLKIDAAQRNITVTGIQKRFASATSVEDGREKYQLTYQIVNRRFFIDGIKEVDLK